MFINPNRSYLPLKFGVRRSPKCVLSWSKSSFGVYIFEFLRTHLGSVAALSDYSSCAPASPVHFKWR